MVISVDMVRTIKVIYNIIYIHTGEKKFECKVCSAKLSTNLYPVKHAGIHQPVRIKPFSCNICARSFAEKSNLNQHLRLHEKKLAESKSPIKYECYVCGDAVTYKHLSNLRRHMRLHFGEKPLSCNVCAQKFSYTTDLKRHMKEHGEIVSTTVTTTANKFQCQICEYSSKYGNHLREHLRRHIGEKPYTWNVCSKMFASSSHLNRHSRTHGKLKLFKCEICSKKFRDQSILNNHFRWTHSNEKPEKKYKCSVCSLRLRNKYHLKIHARSHSGERPFQCEICSKGFAIRSHLNRHMLSHANGKVRTKPKTQPNYQCYICSSKRKSIFDLIDHFYKHRCERRFKCSICAKKCINLFEHMNVHTIENKNTKEQAKLKCYICKQLVSTNMVLKRHLLSHINGKTGKSKFYQSALRTRRSDHLRSHLLTHTGEKPYKCHKCPNRYTKISHLKRHDITHMKSPYICQVCSQNLIDKEGLLRHQRMHLHKRTWNLQNKKFLECHFCTFSTIRKDTLTIHMQMHKRQLSCSVRINKQQMDQF